LLAFVLPCWSLLVLAALFASTIPFLLLHATLLRLLVWADALLLLLLLLLVLRSGWLLLLIAAAFPCIF
jgi:hypothetical protein